MNFLNKIRKRLLLLLLKGEDNMIMMYVLGIVDYKFITDWDSIPWQRQDDVAETMLNLGYEEELRAIGWEPKEE